MLKKSRRLRAGEVAEVSKIGRSVRATHLSLKHISGSHPLRAAVVVPKSLVRLAVGRSRLKRAVYRALSTYPLATHSGNAVFFVRGIPKDSLATEFKNEILFLLSKIK